MKIGTRLITYLVVTLIVVMSAHALLNIVQSARELRNEVHRTAVKIAHIVAVNMRTSEPGREAENLSRLFNTLGRLEGVLDLVVHSPEGKVIARSHVPSANSPAQPALEPTKDFPPGGFGRDIRWGDTKAYEYIFPLSSPGGEPTAFIHVVMDLSFIEHHNVRARWTNILSIGVMTVLLAILFFFFTRRSVIIPLDELTRAVVSFRQGNWSQRIFLPKEGEIGILAGEFNTMADEIERVNRHLMLEREHQRAIVHGLREAVMVLDAEGRVLTWNPAALELSGLAQDDQGAAGSLTRFLDGMDGKLLAAVRDVAGGQREEISLPSLECKRPDGTTRRVRSSVTRLKEGPMAGRALLVLEDVTEQEALTHQVMRAERLASIGQLVSGIAHEIGTPMNVVSGRVQQALGRLDESHPAREKLSPVVAQIDRISGLVRRLLAFARGGPIQPREVDLNTEVRTVVDLLESMRRSAGVELRLDLEKGLPAVHADPGQMQQLLMNLCVNALQAMEGGGRLAVATRKEPDGVLLSVSDTGPGIDPSILDRVFDPFFTTKDVGNGTGLGLTVCHRIVEDHRGRIDAENQPAGGTAFHVRLPLTHQEAPHGRPVA